MPTVRHSPAGVRSITIDWTSRASRDPDALILATGETISSSTWTVPAGLTQASASSDASSSSITISGGTAGQTYTLRCEVATSAGREIEQSEFVECEHT